MVIPENPSMGSERGVVRDYPFPAVVGMELAKRALTLLAIDPGLKGVLISAPAGSGKSLIAQSFSTVLSTSGPDFSTSIRRPAASQTDFDIETRATGDKPHFFVEVPINVTDDRLLGGLDWERTLVTGKRHVAQGLLAEAHGGVLLVNEINLLKRTAVHHITHALATGEVRLEREGLSMSVPSEFLLIGTYDPVEGAAPPSLTESVGLHVRQMTDLGCDDRVEIIIRAAEFRRDPVRFAQTYKSAALQLRQTIAEARTLLPGIRTDPKDRRKLSAIAAQLGLPGHRADIFADHAARANAALHGRRRVLEEDLETAVQLVLAPRAKDPQQPDSSLATESNRATSSEPEISPIELQFETELTPGGATKKSGTPPLKPIDDLAFQAVDTNLPDNLLWRTGGGKWKRKEESSQRRMSHRGERLNRQRGRFAGAIGGQAKSGRIAIESTLRAAAPFQLDRQRTTCPRTPRLAFTVSASDLRFKQFSQKTGLLIVFVVDASGSMALNRIRQAKGAIMRLLKRAYIHRDKVALVSFRGEGAEVLLPPSQSIDLAKRALDILPVGGGTPLAAGLLGALDVAQNSQQSACQQSLIVLLTDGRANVPCVEATANSDPQTIWRQLERIGRLLRSQDMNSIIIDTESRFTTSGEGKKLADLLNGEYFYLPHPDANAVCNAVTTTAESIRSNRISPGFSSAKKVVTNIEDADRKID